MTSSFQKNNVRILHLFCLAMVIFGLVGCSSNGSVTPDSRLTPHAEEIRTAAGHPTPTAAMRENSTSSQIEVESPLSAPTSPLAPADVSLRAPFVTTESGGLSGQLLIARSTGDVAVAGLYIGLAEVILGEDGTPWASGYEPSAAPRVTTDDHGRFVFDNLRPGLYTLILDAVITQYQLDYAETGDTILVEIKPNEVVDLGQLRYPSLPIPGF